MYQEVKPNGSLEASKPWTWRCHWQLDQFLRLAEMQNLPQPDCGEMELTADILLRVWVAEEVIVSETWCRTGSLYAGR